MVIFCKYCNREFATKPNLLRHQRTVTSCIQLQKNGKCEKFDCRYCKKSYTDKSNLNRHLPKCKVKRASDVDEKIKELEEESTCEHNWEDADNEVVSGAEVCSRCFEIRAKGLPD